MVSSQTDDGLMTPDVGGVSARTRLTDKQRQIYNFIVSTIASRGRPPTVREIADAFGLRSTNSISEQLLSIEKKGWLRLGQGTARSIRLMGETCRACGGLGVVTPTPTGGAS